MNLRESIRRGLKHPLPRIDPSLYKDKLTRQILVAMDRAWERFVADKKALVSDRTLSDDAVNRRYSTALDRYLRAQEKIRPLENRHQRRMTALLKRSRAKAR